MKLTPEQYQRMLKRLDAVWKRPRRCPICRDRRRGHAWHISDTLHAVRTSDGTAGHLFVLASCSNCGNTLFFHATLLRFLEEG